MKLFMEFPNVLTTEYDTVRIDIGLIESYEGNEEETFVIMQSGTCHRVRVPVEDFRGAIMRAFGQAGQPSPILAPN